MRPLPVGRARLRGDAGLGVLGVWSRLLWRVEGGAATAALGVLRPGAPGGRDEGDALGACGHLLEGLGAQPSLCCHPRGGGAWFSAGRGAGNFICKNQVAGDARRAGLGRTHTCCTHCPSWRDHQGCVLLVHSERRWRETLVLTGGQVRCEPRWPWARRGRADGPPQRPAMSVSCPPVPAGTSPPASSPDRLQWMLVAARSSGDVLIKARLYLLLEPRKALSPVPCPPALWASPRRLHTPAPL